jgi:two-component system response regulator YesN
MIRLLIVDDEPIERQGLHAILKDGFPDMEIGEAVSGKAAMDMVDSFRPDLVLMDIKMPGMDGLEAIRRLREAGREDIRFIMVTAYDTFDFAHQAIRLGVVGYILKPSKASEIIETVGRAIRAIEAERREREDRRQSRDAIGKMKPVVEADLVARLLFDHTHEVGVDEMLRLLGAEAPREAFVMVAALSGMHDAESYYLSLKETVKQSSCGWVGALSSGQIPLVVFREEGLSHRAQASSLARRLLALANRWPNLEIKVGIGRPCDALERIRGSYREALLACAGEPSASRYRFYEDCPVTVGEGQAAASDPAAEKQLKDHVRMNRWVRVGETVSDAIRRMELAGTEPLEAQQRVLDLLLVISRELQEMGAPAEKPLFSLLALDYRQLRAETDAMLERLTRAAEEHRNRLETDAVRKIERFVRDHCREDLSLETIARQVGLSPHYVSKFFKERTGVNYIDYLTECRVEKAKELMRDPGLSLKEIAIDVGYRDPNYFSKVFRKVCGLTPSEYRDKLAGR